jgi:hypothetical protein
MCKAIDITRRRTWRLCRVVTLARLAVLIEPGLRPPPKESWAQDRARLWQRFRPDDPWLIGTGGRRRILRSL